MTCFTGEARYSLLALVLAFVVGSCDAQADQVTDLLYAQSSGQLDGNNYHDATLDRADYWDCNGYSIRACQILIHFGYSCQIAVAGGHAFIVASGKGVAPTYYEPQLGRIFDPNYANMALTVYTLEQYIQHFSAHHCQMPTGLPPAPYDDQVSTAGVQSDQSQENQGSDVGPRNQTTQLSQGEELETEEWEHNGVRYRCKRGLTLVVMADGTLECVTPQVAAGLGVTHG